MSENQCSLRDLLLATTLISAGLACLVSICDVTDTSTFTMNATLYLLGTTAFSAGLLAPFRAPLVGGGIGLCLGMAISLGNAVLLALN